MNVDLTKKAIHFTLAQTKAIVFDCLQVFGQEYCSIIKKAFDER
jgi:oligoendopeptidase F